MSRTFSDRLDTLREEAESDVKLANDCAGSSGDRVIVDCTSAIVTALFAVAEAIARLKDD